MPINHVIEQGESTLSLSDRYGLFAETVWNHPANAELRKKREDMNILMPGDVLVIPDKTPKDVEKPSGKKHRFRRKGIPAMLRLQLFMGEVPRARQKYKLTVDGVDYYGTTNAEGILKKFVPPNAKQGSLIIGPDTLELQISFGYLDPAAEIIGIQKRLTNLGYDCGEPNNELNEATREALRRFQKRFGLKITGEPDDATRKQLLDIHDQDKLFPEEPGE